MPVRWHGGKPDSFNTAPGLSFVLSFVLNGKPTITILTGLWKGRTENTSIGHHLGEDYVMWGLGSVFPSLSDCLSFLHNAALI